MSILDETPLSVLIHLLFRHRISTNVFIISFVNMLYTSHRPFRSVKDII